MSKLGAPLSRDDYIRRASGIALADYIIQGEIIQLHLIYDPEMESAYLSEFYYFMEKSQND
jgi:hypothetical protein